MGNFNVEEERKKFPFLQTKMHDKQIVYFDSAATTQKPKQVIDVLYKFYLQEYGTVHRSIYELSLHSTERYNEARDAVANFLNAKSDEIVFTRGTTDGINLVASSFGEAFIKEGDEIISTEMEHHSNLVPWQMLCNRKKAKLKIVHINDKGELILSEFSKLLSPKTKLVAVGHVANSTGTINPVKEIIALAHKFGAKVLVDGAQAAAHLIIDVKDLDADFYAISGHKMYGPTGIGVLFGKSELLLQMPPIQGGGDMIERVTLEKTTYQTPPLRFEAGTPPIAQVITLLETVNYMKSIRPYASAHEERLREVATEKMSKIDGLKIIGQAAHKGGIISFVVDKCHALDIGTLLDLHGVAIRTGHHCAQPTMDHFKIPSTARVSFGIYNTLQEVDYFVKVLKEVIMKLK